MEEDNIAIRLKGFIDSQGVTHSQFADTCGIARASLSQLLSGRNKKISDVLVGQIHKAYPDLSVLWLMFGEGPMLMSKSNIAAPDASSDSEIGANDTTPLSTARDVATSLDDDTSAEEQRNVRPLNTPANCSNISENQIHDTEIKIAELTRQIDKIRKNPRKVSHITIYYDDSTFETFYPRR